MDGLSPPLRPAVLCDPCGGALRDFPERHGAYCGGCVRRASRLRGAGAPPARLDPPEHDAFVRALWGAAAAVARRSAGAVRRVLARHLRRQKPLQYWLPWHTLRDLQLAMFGLVFDRHMQ